MDLPTGALRPWASASVDTARLDREGRFGDDVRAGMADLGMMGLDIPEEYGGFGASTLLFSRVFGEVGTADLTNARVFVPMAPAPAPRCGGKDRRGYCQSSTVARTLPNFERTERVLEIPIRRGMMREAPPAAGPRAVTVEASRCGA